MTNNARGAVDGNEIFVGDTVMVRGEVIRSVAGVGALVRFYSKTNKWSDWIREQDLCFATLEPDLPDEPVDGAWLLGREPRGTNTRIFRRDDAEGHNDREVRRHDRHWWDVVAEEWIDWPTAVARGAAPGGMLVQMAAKEQP